MGRGISIDNLADEVMKGLTQYSNLTTENMKKAVKKSSNTVKNEIKINAPKDSGDYAKSWTVKKEIETSNKLTMTVHSKNRYQLAHLLEYGHAKANGGRVTGEPHIEPAEQKGVKQLEEEIERSIKNG